MSSSRAVRPVDRLTSRLTRSVVLYEVSRHRSDETHQDRVLVLPGLIRDRLAAHLAEHVPDNPDTLVFADSEGGALRSSNWRTRVFKPACEEAVLPNGLRIHDLRHTAASLLVSAGANLKAVQRHLGHASASMTLDRYSHLFTDDL